MDNKYWIIFFLRLVIPDHCSYCLADFFLVVVMVPEVLNCISSSVPQKSKAVSLLQIFCKSPRHSFHVDQFRCRFLFSPSSWSRHRFLLNASIETIYWSFSFFPSPFLNLFDSLHFDNTCVSDRDSLYCVLFIWKPLAGEKLMMIWVSRHANVFYFFLIFLNI